MCGRSCLTLEPKEVVCACKYKPSLKLFDSGNTQQVKDDDSKGGSDTCVESEYLTPEWRPEFNCGRKYTPSYNIAPTDITPVLVSAEHFGYDTSENGQLRLVVPMMWGMIPSWHKGDYRKHGLTTNNCRLEHLMESKLYGGPFKRGQRCVILCEGFYEWQTTKSRKPGERSAYLLYMPQLNDVVIYDKSTWSADKVKLLKMAGIFDVWSDCNGDSMYSYSVITLESSDKMSWLHHRMPAILETEEDVNDWLDSKRITAKSALSILRPPTQLKWHRVSNIVNNSRNKSDQCNKPIDSRTESKTLSTTNNIMLKWLTVRKRQVHELEKTACDDGDEKIVLNTESATKEENPLKRKKPSS